MASDDIAQTEADAYYPETTQKTPTYWWLWVPLIIILSLGLTFSWLAWSQNDLTIAEALAAGFIGVGGLFVGLMGGLFGIVVGLVATVFALLTAGGVLALTGFVLASPVIALILIWMMYRRSKPGESKGASAAQYYDYDPY